MDIGDAPAPLRPLLVVDGPLARAVENVLSLGPIDEATAERGAQVVARLNERGWAPTAQAELIDALRQDVSTGALSESQIFSDDLIRFIDVTPSEDVFA